MPAFSFPAGRFRLLSIAGGLLLLIPALLQATPLPHAAGGASFARAQRMREALEGRPEAQRTRRDYERVIDTYRAVYRANPHSPRADAAVSAVADLLAEEGRVFEDATALQAAIGQYEFLRTHYPNGRYRYSALLTEGEIYLRDLNDREDAREKFNEFLRLYPQSSLANEARIELTNLRHPSGRSDRISSRGGARNSDRNSDPAMVAEAPAAPPPAAPHSRHHTVLTAAIQSQAAADAPPPSRSANRTTKHVEEDAAAPTENDLPPQPADIPAASATERPATGRPAPVPVASDLTAPPPRRNRLPLVTGIRHWSTPVYTRVAIDLQDEVQYEAVRVPNPDRIFFDLHGTRLSPVLVGKSDQVIDDGFLKRIRTAQFSNNVTRIVLDVNNVSQYSAFFLPNPPRLIIDVHGSDVHGSDVHGSSVHGRNSEAASLSAPATRPTSGARPRPSQRGQAQIGQAQIRQRRPTAAAMAAESDQPPPTSDSQPSELSDVASLSQQPNRVRATRRATTAPVEQTVAGTTPAAQPDALAATNAPAPQPQATQITSTQASATQSATTQSLTRKHRRGSAAAADANAPVSLAEAPATIHVAQPTANGDRSLVRTLGLKINRIVIDAGHGGHDSGTLGPGGIEEKNVVLDVALRLGALLKQRLGADVIYTRDDDTFIPLETRTAIANKAQADLFISIHANSSPDSSARGVETYYLNFTTSADALEVAARENAVSSESIHQLSDLVKKITLQDKINESREFASDVEQSMYSGLEEGNPGLKDRGVKKAPFVVLIGANMPSILAEISFLTNTNDAAEMQQPAYRERIAESLYRGVARYVDSLSGVRLAQR
jgi:N-acetylmuramoyl-L-alanine amidase